MLCDQYESQKLMTLKTLGVVEHLGVSCVNLYPLSEAFLPPLKFELARKDNFLSQTFVDLLLKNGVAHKIYFYKCINQVVAHDNVICDQCFCKMFSLWGQSMDLHLIHN